MIVSPLSKKWSIAPKIPPEIDVQLSQYPEVLRQLLFNRNVRDPETAETFLNGESHFHDPFLMTGMSAVVDRLLTAIDLHEKIAVYGDYDVDGVTACTLLVSLLRRFGGEVRHYIPNRFDEGYGLNVDAIEFLHNQGVDLIVTVDCGIRSLKEADYAAELGMEMIISDHHEPDEEIPKAFAVVSPRKPGDPYPEKNLAGVGLAFKIAQALLEKRPVSGVYASDFLDLVAVGTVADIVPLVGENRSLVREGLKKLRFNPRQGLMSLSGAAGLNIRRTTARDIGFILGPRLNAAGRLDSATDAFSLLMTDEVQTAGMLAQKLDDLNRNRQRETRKMVEEALNQVEAQEPGYLIFAANSSFSVGILGLVAARLTESCYLPSIIAHIDQDTVRASCRSIPEFHITRALDECADILVQHGGHAMAAGFTVKAKNLDQLIDRLTEISVRELSGTELSPVLHADLEIKLSDLKPEILDYLDAIEPTGMDNAEALFVSRGLKVSQFRKVGREGTHLKLVLTDGTITYNAIAFNQGHWAENMPGFIDVIYSFGVNHYQGREYLQLNVMDIKPSDIE